MSRRITNSEAIEKFKQLEHEEDGEKIKKIESELVAGCGFLVLGITKRYGGLSNYEDLCQEGYIGLLRAVRKFNYNKFPNFFIYANRWITNYVLKSAKRYDIVYNPDKKKTIYSEPKEDDAILDVNQEDEFFEKERISVLNKILLRCNNTESEVLRRSLGANNGRCDSLRKIGNDLNISHEKVRQIKNNAVEKISAHFRKNYPDAF